MEKNNKTFDRSRTASTALSRTWPVQSNYRDVRLTLSEDRLANLLNNVYIKF